ncbi:Y-family DNA polymerase [Corynebacterium sp. H78]|uniref:Y-family DNA polymerase n=1 Tax=Corynebacterium sp. H78 TaxID=3133417 RepID=UPI0030A07704
MANQNRVIGLWLPDWPVQAALLAGVVEETATALEMPYSGVLTPVALIGRDTAGTVGSGGAVVVRDCSQTARDAGVRRGQRRRQAQATCPEVVVLDEDPVRDAHEFEPIVGRLESIAAGVEALRPGFVVMNAKGPAGYYGGEAKALEMLLDAAATQGVDCQIGVADDVVTAVLATRRNVQLPVGAGAEFRKYVSLREVQAEVSLGFPETLARAWDDLGLRTLGDVSAIPARDIATRFGTEGMRWRYLAEHGERQLVAARAVPADLTVRYVPAEESVDGRPLQRVDEASFVARALATKLHETLGARGYLCQRLAVTAEFSDRQELRRVWRCAEPLTETATVDRVRWQLDGWLSRREVSVGTDDSDGHGIDVDDGECSEDRGIIALTLEPLDVIEAGAIKDALWGRADESVRRAHHAAVRVQGLLGADAVSHPVVVGGRGPGERIAMIPVGEEQPVSSGEWHGAMPAPNPAVVVPHGARHPAAQIRVLDAQGQAVVVTGRATLTGEPHSVTWAGQNHAVTAWAGPWPVDERWWTVSEGRRAARLQIAIDKAAFLLIGSKGQWRIEGKYS